MEEAVQTAIDVGYRHIDSAYLYQNEEEIGRAIGKKIADGTVKREDIFYTTKVLCIVPSVSVNNDVEVLFSMMLEKRTTTRMKLMFVKVLMYIVNFFRKRIYLFI